MFLAQTAMTMEFIQYILRYTVTYSSCRILKIHDFWYFIFLDLYHAFSKNLRVAMLIEVLPLELSLCFAQY